MRDNKSSSRFLGAAALIVCFAVNALASGPSVSFTTFLAGSNQDMARAVTVDSAGNTYVTGVTYSNNFPVVSPVLANYQGLGDAFVTKLSPQGTILFSTYWGGSGFDEATGIAVDSTGVYVTGYTTSLNFPGERRAPANGQGHAFVTKLSLTGQEIYSWVLGGSGFDMANAIAIDSSHEAYITGLTSSKDFPVVGSWQLAIAVDTTRS